MISTDKPIVNSYQLCVCRELWRMHLFTEQEYDGIEFTPAGPASSRRRQEIESRKTFRVAFSTTI